ncbi:MAG: cytochrome bc complex cytochrome b subunit [Chloroflexi bacterium]|nr:cytochrome bc complex cytochrome b subunit [Chloroflexota bacterium]
MSVLPFPSFLDDIKEKGLRKAVFEGVDEVVERLTAGMNIQDVREALRGEAPSRKPNPRLTPHADGFWLHMRPSYFHKDMTGLYPTFRLGWLSTYFVFFETITGIFLMIWYTPSPEIAYGNMLNILSNVPLGQLMRDLHRLGAEGMVLIVWLHMLRTFLTGSYKKPRQFTWFTGVVLLIATMFLSFTGYLLPWDQLALWAVTIGASMVEAAPPPIVGQTLNLLFRGGPELGANGLLRFYLLHVLLVPAVLFVFTGVHYYKVIVHGHSLPPQKENIGEDTAKRVPLDKRVYFIPDVLTSEMMWIAVTTFVLVVLCVWFFHAPLENHADPQVTPLGTTAPWYFLWIQGALKLGDKVFWGIIFPTLVIILLMVWPYVDTQPSRRYAHRRFAITVCALFVSIMTILSYMGLPEYGVTTSADSEIRHELTMEPAHSHIGIIRPVPFEQLVPGIYTTEQIRIEREVNPADLRDDLEVFNQRVVDLGHADAITSEMGTQQLPLQAGWSFDVVPADAPLLHEVLVEFYEMMEEERQELRNGYGIIIITESQPNLRRVDVLIHWEEVLIDRGHVALDANGNSIPLFYQLDDQGARVLDDNGRPVITSTPTLDPNGTPLNVEPIERITSSHIFLHRSAEYFHRPGGN